VPTYLGFDASTQSLTAVLIDVDARRRDVILERAMEYDAGLPQYGTTHGVVREADPAVVVSPPLMWVEALDRMMAALAAERPRDMSRLAAISGAAQQHGSVYLNARALPRIAHLDAGAPLAEQMAGVFSRALSPVWMDSSSTAACREIAAAVGGNAELARRTGSRAFERFTGPQIRRFFTREPAAYAATARIHLVSSFLATLLAGADAPIEPGDGSGMNLMDLVTGTWWPAALDATAPDLATKLPAVVPSATVVGALAPYWRDRYGLPAAKVVAWSGDNPSSLIGTGLVREGRVGISLGTSDTIFGLMREPRVDASGTGHVFGAPTGEYMAMTVFKNGSLARERVRDAWKLDWEGFSAALRATPPGNGGAIMVPWFEPEITPDGAGPGVRRFGLAETDGPANIRAVVEGQMMAMANHSRWMGVAIEAIHATGGAAVNRDVLQVMADVFGADVYPCAGGNSAALGAALRAWHADRLASGTPVTWDEVVAGFAEPVAGTRVPPIPARVTLYAGMRGRYAECEATAMGRRDDGRPV
jgi:xylulokinase